MRAMILAAGRGQRMRPLTDTCPKPLLPLAGQPLIVWQIQRLVQAGFRQIMINHAWLGEQIEAALGDGARWGAQLSYSPETTVLETAGGIAQALPFFEGQAFLVVNGDVWCDWDYARAGALAQQLTPQQALACLVMVDNPTHRPEGDFFYPNDTIPWRDPNTCAMATTTQAVPLVRLRAKKPAQGADAALPTRTFAGIGIYRPELFNCVPPGKAMPLAPLLHQAIAQQQVLGIYHCGEWVDVGTPLRLAQLEARLAARA